MEKNEAIIKQLAQVICICKGIPLRRVLPALEGSETVEDVNRKAGTGCGGCKGQRCGPKIRILLEKMRKKKATPSQEPSKEG
ncbi:MAG: (2Fe-2S)-binding protein [Oligoflexales bacterium]|nr:(2Fe-2S)-binding protein [Oligoflexales bacterium]